MQTGSLVSKCLSAVLALSGATSLAAVPNYGTIYNDGKIAVLTGSVSELQLTSGGSGSGSFNVTLPTGFATAEIFLTGASVQFDDATGQNVRRVRVSVKPDANIGGYDPTTGSFDWLWEAALQAFPVPTNSNSQLNLDFTIMLTNDVDAIVRRTTLSSTSFFKPGTSVPCDTSAKCENSTTLTGVGSATAAFRHAFIGGFDIRLSSASRGLSFSELAVSTEAYSASGTTATGLTSVAFAGVNATNGAVENINTSVDVVTVAADNINYPFTPTSESASSQVGIINLPNFRNSPTASNAVGAYQGLQRFSLSPSFGSTPVQLLYFGCGFGSLVFGGGTTGRWNYQYNFALLETQPSPSLQYNAAGGCQIGWLP